MLHGTHVNSSGAPRISSARGTHIGAPLVQMSLLLGRRLAHGVAACYPTPPAGAFTLSGAYTLSAAFSSASVSSAQRLPATITCQERQTRVLPLLASKHAATTLPSTSSCTEHCRPAQTTWPLPRNTWCTSIQVPYWDATRLSQVPRGLQV